MASGAGFVWVKHVVARRNGLFGGLKRAVSGEHLYEAFDRDYLLE